MKFQLSYFKSWKMMLWKCCIQYASKLGKPYPWLDRKCCTQYASTFGKLSSGHRTGKGQFSFQSQRKAMPKNDQTTTQLHSSHTLAKKCSKFSKPGFNSPWTMNFQMFKLYLEKAEEPKIKLPTFTESQKNEGNSRKTSASLTTLKPVTVWITTHCEKFLKRWEYQTTLPFSWETCIQDKKQQNWIWNWFKIGKGIHQGCILLPLLI